jgi:two-component system response regulator RegA
MSERSKSLLIVDDDMVYRQRLAVAMEKRGFIVRQAESVAGGIAAAKAEAPDYAVVDLRLNAEIRNANPDCRVVMLTGYGNIATAVAAIKHGAADYLPKPADADQVEAALLEDKTALPPPPEQPMTADRVRWEHIQRVFEQCDRNVSETARRLRMHRRTLQRILAKYAPRG